MLQLDTLPVPPVELQAYEWRAARREDAPALHELLLAAEAVDQTGFVDTLEDRERDFDDPGSNFETDTLLAFTPQGQAAAMAWVYAPPVGQTEYVAHLWGQVHPAHRARGLGNFILTWMERRGRQLLAERPAGLPHALRAHAEEKLADRLALFAAHEFQPVRSAYRMRRDLSEPIPAWTLPEGIRLQPWSRELDEATFESFKESFSDHWGYIPMPKSVWDLWMTGHPYFQADLSFLAISGEAGIENPVAGFSINQIRSSDNAHSGLKEGWIQELGVRRPWRQQGIATALLCASLRAFQEAGLEVAGLGVDTENTTGALRIYERLGFRPIQRTITFHKDA